MNRILKGLLSRSFSAAILTVLIALVLFSCSGKRETEFFTGRVNFSVQPNLGVKEAMAARLIPHPRQLEWQKLEMTAFIHFTMNTFTAM